MAIPVLVRSGAACRFSARWPSRRSFFYFFVNVRDHQDVYVGWRVGHFLFMAAAVVIGVLLEKIAASSRSATWQPLQWALLSRSRFLAGLPTTIIDIYNTQDITNHSQAPRVPLDADAAAG